MHEWTHATRNGFCGGCDTLIAEGDPVRVTTIVGVTKKFVRCEECAGPAPPELPPYVVTARAFSRFVPLQAASPERTRGGLRRATEWMPYRDTE